MSGSPFSFAPTNLSATAPTSVAEVIEAIIHAAQNDQRALVIGGGTAWDAGHRAFANDSANISLISIAKLSGILEYDSGELTITARAGTRLAEVQAELAKHGQYLPFDPPFAEAGATLGGVVAAGLTGPRRMRYGGLRDFILGIEFVNAQGQAVRGGGKVVKNAAGYDLPKLFCGSMGSLGIITEVSFKVFPKLPDHRTLLVGLKTAADARRAFHDLQASPIEISAADAWNAVPVMPSLAAYTVAVLIEGTTASLESRLTAARRLFPADAPSRTLEDDAALWTMLRDLAWIGDAETVLRIYLPLSALDWLDGLLAANDARRIYSGAGNTAWAAIKGDPARLASELAKIDVRAAVWRSPLPAPDILPDDPGAAMIQRVRRAFDPAGRFYGSLPHPPTPSPNSERGSMAAY